MLDEDQLDRFEAEHAQVLARLAEAAALDDPRELRELARRHKELEAVVQAARRYRAARGDLEAARELLGEAGPDERDTLRREVAEAEERLSASEAELRELLLPRDPYDGRNVLLTIRGGEGGEEANLFARDLLEMYRRYAERRGWSFEVLGLQPSPLGGVDEVTVLVGGEDAWQRLKHEAGTHRVQRVPVTEAQGRLHTSAATVNVLPEAEEVEVQIDPADLRIDVFRSTGPGGQSVNTTDSAVRITHRPTGIVVSMQDEKSQIQNRAKAMRVLRARLLAREEERRAAERARTQREQVGSGGRADKVRTYHFKENRVTDHRVGLTLYKLDRVLEGELDEIVDALAAADRARQLGAGGR
jgi:peptide chain release factor 1